MLLIRQRNVRGALALTLPESRGASKAKLTFNTIIRLGVSDLGDVVDGLPPVEHDPDLLANLSYGLTLGNQNLRPAKLVNTLFRRMTLDAHDQSSGIKNNAIQTLDQSGFIQYVAACVPARRRKKTSGATLNAKLGVKSL